MEIYVEVSFSVDQTNTSFWKSVFKAMENGQIGTVFQQKMSGFGSEVDQKIEAMLDEWPIEYFAVEGGWSCKKNRIAASFVTASDGDQFASDLDTLFRMCGVNDLKISLYADDE